MVTQVAVTVGYDALWRHVHALLLRAAERTPGIRRTSASHLRLALTKTTDLKQIQRFFQEY